MSPANRDQVIQAGDVVGSYRVEGQLGQGGMSTVYAARHRGIGKPAAIKVLRPSLVADRRFGGHGRRMMKRFLREARLLSRVRHDNVVSVLDFCHLRGELPCLILEHLEGPTVQDLLEARGALRWADAFSLTRQLLRAAQAVHEQGVVHRDIKPDNCVLVDVGGKKRLVLIDFGVAKDYEQPGPRITQARVIVGTPSYMAPEQARGAASGPQTDLYAIGIILFELLAGRPPFLADSPAEVVSMQLHASPPSLFELAPHSDAPLALARVIARALAKDPKRRYESAAEMLADLESVRAHGHLAGEGPPSAQDTLKEPVAVADGAAGGAEQDGIHAAKGADRVTPIEGLPSAAPSQPDGPRLRPLGGGEGREWAVSMTGPTHLRRRPLGRRLAWIAGGVATAAAVALTVLPSAREATAASLATMAEDVSQAFEHGGEFDESRREIRQAPPLPGGESPQVGPVPPAQVPAWARDEAARDARARLEAAGELRPRVRSSDGEATDRLLDQSAREHGVRAQRLRR